MYDVRGGGDYVAAALPSLGISDEQLLRNLAPRLSEKIQETHAIPWPPRVDDLEEGEEMCGLLVQLLSWLKQPKRQPRDSQFSFHDHILYHRKSHQYCC